MLAGQHACLGVVLVRMPALVLYWLECPPWCCTDQHARLGGVIVSMLALSAPIMDSFPWSDQTNIMK